MASLQQQQQPDADKAMVETSTNRQIFRLKEKLRIAQKEINKLHNQKTALEMQAVQIRTEREQLNQAARREFTTLRNDKSTLKKQTSQDGKKIDKLNKKVTNLEKENRRLKEEPAEKNRVQAAKDKKLIMQQQQMFGNIWNDNKNLRGQNDRLRLAEIKLKEEKEQLTASQKNSQKQIQTAQDFLNGAGAVLVDNDNVV
jgi:chromosome segregation ATPase